MRPGFGWTSQQEVDLVEQLSKRKHLQAAWLPTSEYDIVSFGPALDSDGKYKAGTQHLNLISQEVCGRGDQTKDAGSVRNKLVRMFDRYFRELKILNTKGAANRHARPLDELPVDDYRTLRENLAVACPWWDRMHAIMVKRNPSLGTTPAAPDPPKISISAAGVKVESSAHESLDLATFDLSNSTPTAFHDRGTFSTWRTKAKALMLQNNQLKLELALEKKEVENLRLREQLNTLEARVQSLEAHAQSNVQASAQSSAQTNSQRSAHSNAQPAARRAEPHRPAPRARPEYQPAITQSRSGRPIRPGKRPQRNDDDDDDTFSEDDLHDEDEYVDDFQDRRRRRRRRLSPEL